MIYFMLIFYLGKSPEGIPKFIVKNYSTELECKTVGSMLESTEKLQGNTEIWFTCNQTNSPTK